MTPDQTEVLLFHLQLLTARLFALSGAEDKIELMQSLQDVMVAFGVQD